MTPDDAFRVLLEVGEALCVYMLIVLSGPLPKKDRFLVFVFVFALTIFCLSNGAENEKRRAQKAHEEGRR